MFPVCADDVLSHVFLVSAAVLARYIQQVQLNFERNTKEKELRAGHIWLL